MRTFERKLNVFSSLNISHLHNAKYVNLMLFLRQNVVKSHFVCISAYRLQNTKKISEHILTRADGDFSMFSPATLSFR